MISYFFLLTLWFCTITAARIPSYNSVEISETKTIYPSIPSEILPIEPVLIYPAPKRKLKKGRAYNRDNEIIYIKLLKRKSYKPKKVQNQIEDQNPTKAIQMKDIFYVKALANGQFSHNRLKLYRLPEFYAITVYRKGQLEKR